MSNLLSFLSIVIVLSGLFCDKIVRIQEVKVRDVDCSHIDVILEEVYDMDQKIRTTTTDFKTFVKMDHENLEKVVSIIEKCGMPTLNEISQKQMDASS